MKKHILSALALGLIATNANAACAATGCVNVLIESVLATSNGNVLISTNGDENALNCTAPGGGKFMTLKADIPGQKTMYSALLSTFVTKQKVQINIIPGSSTCEIAFINLLK